VDPCEQIEEVSGFLREAVRLAELDHVRIVEAVERAN
jgi:hypothetical protein